MPIPKITNKGIRNWCLAAVLTSTFSSNAIAGTSGIESGNDFAQIGKNGLELVVDGSFFVDPVNKIGFPNLVPNPLGLRNNSYAWSMALFGEYVYVGFVRDILCYLGSFSAECSGIPGPAQRPEIWRYLPNSFDAVGDWGLGGTWERVYTSGNVDFLIALLGGLSTNAPRDIGYRNLKVCDAGDGIPRLYAASFGIPGRIYFHEGGNSGFTPVSESGLSSGYLDWAQGTVDLGYRAMACYKRRLWISPAGSLSDVDAAANPVVLMNPWPAQGSGWQTMLNVQDMNAATGDPLSDPGNIGIFQMEVVDDYLYLSTGNRESGFELWRGEATSCPEANPSAACVMTWTKVIDNGAGRPADGSDPVVDNAGATLGVFGNALYMGAAESGFFDTTTAELLRVPDATVASPTWELLAGWPRANAAPGGSDTLDNFDCSAPGNISPLYASYLPFLDSAPDSDNDDCFPASGYGPGMGTASGFPYYGSASYFWRFQEHLGDLFITTLDVFGSSGFDMWRTDNGTDYTRIFNDGLGNPYNYGGRTMASVPGLGLVLGTANPYTDEVDSEGNPAGGFEIFVGTTEPIVPPQANAGDDDLIFDWDGGGVSATLTVDASSPIFGGADIVLYEWYSGDVGATQVACAGLASGPVLSEPHEADCNDTSTPECTVDLASEDAGNDILHHVFTLRVTDTDNKVSCDTVTITASANLPPTAEVVASIPFARRGTGGGSDDRPNAREVDFGDSPDGEESYSVVCRCEDADGDLVQCEWWLRDEGNSLSNETTCPPGSSSLCEIEGTITTLTTDQLDAAGGPTRPDVYCLAEDANGYTGQFRWESQVLPAPLPDSNLAENDPPVCRSIALNIPMGGMLDIDPTAPAGDGDPICVDPDNDVLSYEITVQPDTGQAGVGSITYDPPNAVFEGIVELEYRAKDPSDAKSELVAIRVTVGDPPFCEPIVISDRPDPIDTVESYATCGSITVGPNVSVASTGGLVLVGQTIVFSNGVSISGSLSAGGP
ncbi:MAG: hypothetical protein LJE70_09570 [Chromatiaceae bacterium]|nr:hypothetical protein [Chromatiaceae bacterium]